MRLACDAMCGGLARWLRVIGYDTFYREGIADGELVELALAHDRVVISSDGKLLERRLFTTGRLQAVALPRGLKLHDQLDYVARALRLAIGDARCTRCNGELIPASRDEVGDRVPARSLIWAKQFFRCADCTQVFWDGTHWRRIAAVRQRIASLKWDELAR
ncbi:MAG: Mut7-C RNAse domain-containing protein [Planctomycetota bacterium]